MRNRFDTQLEQMNNELIQMGALIECAIASASKSLTDKDLDKAKKAKEADSEVDQKEREIESLCLKLLLHQQPVARDLRLISAVLKMITDMERIGDQAADIADIAPLLVNESYVAHGHIPKMAKATIAMVTASIDAFVKNDIELAQSVYAMDDAVDELFIEIKNEIIDIIRNNCGDAERAMDMLMVAKYFERIGDHAVNIAEWVEFAVTGVHKGIDIAEQ